MELRAVAASQLVGERVPHVRRLDSVRLVEVRFERQDHQHPRHVAHDLPHPVRAPSPDAGADEVRDRNLQRAKLPRQPQVEVGAVDQQRRRGPAVAGGVAERIHRIQDARQRRQHLGHAHHRELLGVDQRFESLRAHPRAARAERAHAGTQCLQLAQDGRAVQIGRRLDGHHQQVF